MPPWNSPNRLRLWLTGFSGDINIIDEVLPGVIQSFVSCAFQVVSVVCVVVYVTPWFVVALVPLYKIYAYTQGFYIRSTRELKRLEVSTQSLCGRNL